MDAQQDKSVRLAGAPAGQGEITRDDYVLLRAAAKDLFNKSFADKEVTISSTSEAKRDAVVVAITVFQEVIKATPAPDDQPNTSRAQRTTIDNGAATGIPAGGEVEVHQWRRKPGAIAENPPWYDASKEEAYGHVSEFYEARTVRHPSHPSEAKAGETGPWQVLEMKDQPEPGRLLDVVLTNGVIEEGRAHSAIDWTQVDDWRYSRAKAGEDA